MFLVDISSCKLLGNSRENKVDIIMYVCTDVIVTCAKTGGANGNAVEPAV